MSWPLDLYIQIPRPGTKWSLPLRTWLIWESRPTSSRSILLDSFFDSRISIFVWAPLYFWLYFVLLDLGCDIGHLWSDFVYHNLYNSVLLFCMLAYDYITLCVILWYLLYLCLAYVRGGTIWPTYMRRSDVPVSSGSGRYRLVSEPRLSNLKSTTKWQILVIC